MSGPGNLKCQKVIHVAEPKWHAGRNPDQEVDEIHDIVYKCLTKTEEENLSSISFPPIGSGSFGHDDEKTTAAIVTGIKNYLLERKGSGPLKEIFLFGLKTRTAEFFTKSVTNIYRSANKAVSACSALGSWQRKKKSTGTNTLIF